MRCSNSGMENEERFTYCTKCGDPLADEKRHLERYGPQDPMHLSSDPNDAVQRPYVKYYSVFGEPLIETKRRFWSVAAFFSC